MPNKSTVKDITNIQTRGRNRWKIILGRCLYKSQSGLRFASPVYTVWLRYREDLNQRGKERCLVLYIFLTSVCEAIPGCCIKLHGSRRQTKAGDNPSLCIMRIVRIKSLQSLDRVWQRTQTEWAFYLTSYIIWI